MKSQHNLATIFGVGYTLYMPGTAASLLALSLAMLVVTAVGYWLVWILAAVAIVLGFRASAAYATMTAQWDPRECVIDEFAAVLLIACFMPLYMPSWIAAIIAFRIFDIWKPYPIDEVEKMMEPGPRIMGDDLVAALPAIAAGWVVYFGALLLGF